MLGISVKGRRTILDPKLFRLKPDFSDGFFNDTGCPHSVLVEPAYRIVKEVMIQYFSTTLWLASPAAGRC